MLEKTKSKEVRFSLGSTFALGQIPEEAAESKPTADNLIT